MTVFLKYFLSVSTVALVIFCFGSCASHTKQTHSAKNAKLTFVYTAGLGSELEPCGCREKPIGGVVRKANFLKKIRSDGTEPIVVDAGNLFFESNKIHISLREQLLYKARLVVESYNLMGHTVYAPGTRDLAGGKAFLKELSLQAKFPFITANLVDVSSGQPLFPAHAIVERLGMRVAFIGITEPNVVNEFYHAEVKALPMDEALQKALAASKNLADIWVVVGNMDAYTARTLAEKFPEVALWFTSDTGGSDFPEIKQVTPQHAQVFFTPQIQGQKVGIVSLPVTKSFKRLVDRRIVGRIEEINRGLEVKVAQLIAANGGDEKKLAPAVKERVSDYRDEIKRNEQRLIHGTSGEVVFDHHMEEMNETYDGHNPLELIVRDYKEAVRTKNFSMAPAKIPPLSMTTTKTYTDALKLDPKIKPKGLIQPGAEGISTYPRCQTCHVKQTEFWRGTRHASAMLVLYSKNQHMNLECLTCHTIGFEEPHGWTTPGDFVEPNRKLSWDIETFFSGVFKGDPRENLDGRKDPKRYAQLKKKYHTQLAAFLQPAVDGSAFGKDMMGVQCEHCHGRREGHPQDSKPYPKKVTQEACAGCHVPEHSDGFSFESHLKRVACPSL